MKTKERKRDQLTLQTATQDKWLAMLREIVLAANIEPADTDVMVFMLRELLKKEREKKIIQKELTGKLEELKGEVQPLENELAALRIAKTELLTLANAADEEEFRQIAKEHEEKNMLTERLLLLEPQLDSQLTAMAALYQSEEELKELQNKLKQSIGKITIELDEHRNQLASLRHELKRLEEGGTYTEKLHRFHQLKSIFNEEAKQWAKLSIAKAMLQKTMDVYKKDRFPKVIDKAQEYMAFLTDGEYDRIHLQPEGSLLLERRDRVAFDPAELSQGTGEQLYTALRLALVQVLKADYPFPVMIDDGFVNFDRKRTEKVLQLISKLSETTQILFFTCHDHIIDHLEGESITHLSCNPHVLNS